MPGAVTISKFVLMFNISIYKKHCKTETALPSFSFGNMNSGVVHVLPPLYMGVGRVERVECACVCLCILDLRSAVKPPGCREIPSLKRYKNPLAIDISYFLIVFDFKEIQISAAELS